MVGSQAVGYENRSVELPGESRRIGRTNRRRMLAVVLSVAVALLLLAVFAPLVLGPVLHPGSPTSSVPIGAVLGFGPATLKVCPGTSTFSSNGCVSGHYVFLVAITSATIALGDFGLVVANSSGDIWSGDSNAGLTFIDANNAVLAQYPTLGGAMYADSDWVYANTTSGSTQLSTSDTLLLDMGQMDPAELGLTLSAFPADGSGYTGTTSPTPLS